MTNPAIPDSIQAALARRGLELPPAPVPNATYVPVARAGCTLYVSGQLPFDERLEVIAKGRLEEEVDLDLAIACAELCALNLLAQLHAASDLARVRLLKVQVFVASAPGFDRQHIVANGASDLLVELLGERGHHARSAFGVAALPFGAPVEVEAFAEELPGQD